MSYFGEVGRSDEAQFIKALLSCHDINSRVFVFIDLFCFTSWKKTKNNVKNIKFVSIPVKNRQNNRRFLKDCFVIRRIVKIFLMSQTKWPPAAN